jgi:predicted kinase
MECVIFVGLPASGKSSFYHERFAATHDHVSKDLMRNVRHPESRQQRSLEESLAAGRSVVVDNTNASRAVRAATIAIARKYGASVIAYFFETAAVDALRRNRTRDGRNRVPDVAIFTTRKRLEPPELEEGFDQVFLVRLHEAEGRFEVTDLGA